MFNQELVILGLLKEGPKHGYQIKKLLHKITESLATLESRSIYYPLKIMERHGLVQKESMKQRGRPEKFIYRITAKGESKFEKLIEKSLSVLERPFLNVDISLYFLPFLSKDLVLHKLRVRQKGLERVKSWLLEARLQKKNLKQHHLAIISHNIELVKAEIQFNSYLIGNFDSLLKN